MRPKDFLIEAGEFLKAYFPETEATQIAQLISDKLEAMLAGGVNTIKLKNECEEIIGKTAMTVFRHQLLDSDLTPLKNQLQSWIDLYLKNKSEAEQVINHMLNVVKDFFKNGEYPSFPNSDLIVDALYKSLHPIIDKKKPLEKFVLHSEYADLFMKSYIEYVKDFTRLQDRIEDQLTDWMKNILKPIEELIQLQEETCERYINQLNAYIQTRMKDFPYPKKEYLDEERYKVIAEMPKASLSMDEQVSYLREKHAEIQKANEKKISEYQDEITKEWCAMQPKEVVDALDIKLIHLSNNAIRTFSDLQETGSVIIKAITSLQFNSNANELEIPRDKLDLLVEKLTEYLLKAKRANLELLFVEPVYEMDVKDLKLKDAMCGFKCLINYLPESIKAAFLAQKSDGFMSGEKLLELDFHNWIPSQKAYENIIELIGNQENFARIVQYNELYTFYRVKRSEEIEAESRNAKQVEIATAITSMANNDKVNEKMIDSFRKMIAQSKISPSYPTLLKHCNLPTLMALSSEFPQDSKFPVIREQIQLRIKNYSYSLSNSKTQMFQSAMTTNNVESQASNTIKP